MTKKVTSLLFLVACLALYGCWDTTLNLKIRFDKVDGLKAGDRLIFDGNHVGNVDKIVYASEGDYVVDVSIRPEFANTATEFSEFYVVADPENKANKAIEIKLKQKGGKPLENGAVVKGSVKATFLDKIMGTVGEKAESLQTGIKETVDQLKKDWGEGSDELVRDLEKTIDDLATEFDKFAEGMNKLPESEDFKKLEKSLEEMADELEKSAKSVQDKIKKDLLPELERELENLRKRLEKQGREKEMRPLDEELEKIKRI